MPKKTTPASRTAGYREFLTEMRARIDEARSRAARSVNHELVLLYWDIGKGIIEKQKRHGWGDAVVERLSRDLSERYPGTFGFSPRNLWDMRRFVENWTRPAILRQAVAELEGPPPGPVAGRRTLVKNPAKTRGSKRIGILRQAVAEIPWGHHLLLMNKVEDVAARIWYLRATAHFGWSRNVLLNQINANAYERNTGAGKSHNFGRSLHAEVARQAEEALKNTYNLEFLGVARVLSERDLEQRLVERIRDFILELGYGFCFVAQQHTLVLGRKEYRVDLLFYHRFLRSLVAIDLKVNEFEPEHAGKMDFYLNVLNDKERGPDDNPSIGIILCAENDGLEVEYSLRSKSNPIGVASYALMRTLPKQLRGQLPSARELKNALAEAMDSESPDTRRKRGTTTKKHKR